MIHVCTFLLFPTKYSTILSIDTHICIDRIIDTYYQFYFFFRLVSIPNHSLVSFRNEFASAKPTLKRLIIVLMPVI